MAVYIITYTFQMYDYEFNIRLFIINTRKDKQWLIQTQTTHLSEYPPKTKHLETITYRIPMRLGPQHNQLQSSKKEVSKFRKKQKS